ncbi:DEAD/DEAH box helicase [Corynebacterium appendicis]|uniref:DEAD/DEAH box helicase n=1 Tax=Corynebacterium appendicis TaxID=163202 RepID=UPI0023549F0E|nr:DEAD/DEAH box helicase [Corynebacterium appendicis]
MPDRPFDRSVSGDSGRILDRFHPQVATWFEEVFAAPTPVQEQAWTSISEGENTLVVAPTGSGKTLAAFLWSLNSMVQRSGQQALHFGDNAELQRSTQGTRDGVKVLYISPLKALGVDVENNLRAPLTGIARVAQRMELDMPDISVAVRSGDTPQAERNRQARKPPDILITTPESLYLMLTSKAAGILKTVDTVIVDEIHALAGTKRGVHLALSMERLRRLAGDFQRIGLSATVRPLDAVANFLGERTTIVNPPAEKKWKLDVHVPVEDMSDLPVPEEGSPIGDAVIDTSAISDDVLDFNLDGPETAKRDLAPPPTPGQSSIWPHIEAQLYQEVMAHQSTIVFVNSRRTAERLTSRLNEIWASEHDPDALSPDTRRPPAQLMKSVDVAGEAAPVIARAHHGSVSKEERKSTETALKEGTLRAVVSTSSLELGIDMGAVDLVVQVESPPSVASGLQRVGRAGHSVGAVSEGSFYPKHRSDLVQTAVTVPRMREGLIEELHTPKSPLDVLAQQTIAAVAVEDLELDDWYETVTRAWPYRDLAREVFDAVIDLVIGIYPSTDFAELRPRAILDGTTLKARPGAQRVAVTNAGTIPDRGMFGVFLVGNDAEGGVPRRVGELDEEMVYESRVGDVFTLGASSWRIENITRDQVQVSPAPGHTGRLPFWSGDSLGRPYELGLALGAFRREAKSDPAIIDASLDAYAHDNLLKYLDEQEEATGIVPDEKTLVLERFTDELGDWRVVLHTPFGKGVNAAWALATGWRVAQETGMDAQAVAGDDGIVLRLPQGEKEPDGSIFAFDADEIADIVTEQVGNSALFASRFRECAARALLLPRRNPGKRAPLWQQRQRAEQLLDVARNYPSFPIILETVRECLQDVYDLPALQDVMRNLSTRSIRVAEVTTDQPSPFASSLLFNYTGAFMYEGDTPLAEKRAAALALDPSLLAKLLGTVELRELLDADVIADVDASLRRLGKAETSEQFADTLRIVGPVPVDELELYTSVPAAALEESLGRRMMRVRIGGREHLAQSFDAPLLRDGLGVPVPPGIAAQVATIPDALSQLVTRWVRTRGPFTLRDLAAAFGLSVGASYETLKRLIEDGKVIEGRYRQGVDEQEYMGADVLRIVRTRSLAAARAQTRPVSQSALGRFMPAWLNIAPAGQRPALRGADGVYSVIEQLAGIRLPASAWESMILPSRVGDYSPEMLDELTLSGEVQIVGAGKAGARDPWIMLLPADYAAQLIPVPEEPLLSLTQQRVMDKINVGGGYLFTDLLGPASESFTTSDELRESMWDLVEAGLIAPDSFAPIRARLAGGKHGKTAHRAKRRPSRSRIRSGRTTFANVTPPDMTGRWAATPTPDTDPTQRSLAHGEAWLDRYGVVTRGSIVAEDIVGGFALAYKSLSGFEEAGKAMRGYLVEGLGAAQFSTPATIDRLRGHQDSDDLVGWPSGTKEPKVYVLAVTDPANPYGAALPWPDTGPTRSAGALVVLIDGLLAAHITRGGKTMTTFFDGFPGGTGTEDELLSMVVGALTDAVAAGRLSPLTVEKLNGEPAFILKNHGAGASPRGAKIGGKAVSSPKRRGRSVAEALEEVDENLNFDD